MHAYLVFILGRSIPVSNDFGKCFRQFQHGFTKLAGRFPSSVDLTAKNAKSAKIFDFLCGIRELCGSEFLSDINLVKP